MIFYIRLFSHSLLFSYLLFAESIAYDRVVTCACFVIVTSSGFGILFCFCDVADTSTFLFYWLSVILLHGGILVCSLNEKRGTHGLMLYYMSS